MSWRVGWERSTAVPWSPLTSAATSAGGARRASPRNGGGPGPGGGRGGKGGGGAGGAPPRGAGAPRSAPRGGAGNRAGVVNRGDLLDPLGAADAGEGRSRWPGALDVPRELTVVVEGSGDGDAVGAAEGDGNVAAPRLRVQRVAAGAGLPGQGE